MHEEDRIDRPMTLTERVGRIEDILVQTGIAGDRRELRDEGGIFPRDEGDVLNRATRHVNIEDEPEFGRGAVGRRDYQDAQQYRNEEISQRIHQEAAAQKASAFEEIINRIQGSAERIRQQAIKLEEIGERILGPIPEDKDRAGGVAAGKPEGTLNHTHLVLDWLDANLDRLHVAAVRLERI